MAVQSAICGAAKDISGLFNGLKKAMLVVGPILGYLGAELVAAGGVYATWAGFATAAAFLQWVVIFLAIAAVALAVTCIVATYLHGDPHLRTADGRSLNFQRTGEFVSFRTDAIEVQTRFEGAAGSATWTQASAIRVGNHVVQVNFPAQVEEDGDLPVLVDGVATTIGLGGRWFEDGGYIAREAGRGRTLIAVSPRGSFARVENLNISQNVEIGASRETPGVGLVGSFDGDSSNDFTTRSGEQLASDDLTVESLYGRFGESWRVTREERLFSDGAWEDYQTPDHLALPEELPSLDQFPEDDQAAAIARCEEAGVPAGEAAEDCAYDFLATGDERWIDQAAQSEIGGVQADAGGPDGPDEPDGLEPIEIEIGERVEGVLANENDTFAFAGQPGDVVIEFLTCEGNVTFESLRGPDGYINHRYSRSTGQETCNPDDPPLVIGPFTLTTAGRHSFGLGGERGSAYAFRVRPAVPGENGPTQIRLGERVEGIHNGIGEDVYEFVAGPGEIVVEFFLCETPIVFYRMAGPDGRDVPVRGGTSSGQVSCRSDRTPLLIGPFTVVTEGRHKLVMESYKEGGTAGADYAFEVRPA